MSGSRRKSTMTDVGRIEYLLAKDRKGTIMPDERRELRQLLAQENPHATEMDWDGLIKLGLVLVGIYAIGKALEERE